MADEDVYGNLATALKSGEYYEALVTIRDDLRLPPDTKHSEMEALLIFAVKDIYNDELEADVALMAVGLLADFSRTQDRAEAKEAGRLYSSRRENFLRQTDFIEKKTEGRLHSYAEAADAIKSKSGDGKTKTELDTIRNTLGKDDKHYLERAISALYSKKENISEYIRAAKKDFQEAVREKGIKDVNWQKWNRIPKELLPALKYLKLIDPTRPQSSTSPIKPDLNFYTREENTDTSEKSQVLKLVIWIIGLVILLVVIVGAIILLFTNTLAEKQGQFEVHTSSCYMRLNFAPSSYDRSPDGEIMFNNEPSGASD